MEILFGILAFLGPLGIVGLSILYNVKKGGWVWSCVVTSALFGVLLCSFAPGLPQSVNDGVKNTISSIVEK